VHTPSIATAYFVGAGGPEAHRRLSAIFLDLLTGQRIHLGTQFVATWKVSLKKLLQEPLFSIVKRPEFRIHSSASDVYLLTWEFRRLSSPYETTDVNLRGRSA